MFPTNGLPPDPIPPAKSAGTGQEESATSTAAKTDPATNAKAEGAATGTKEAAKPDSATDTKPPAKADEATSTTSPAKTGEATGTKESAKADGATGVKGAAAGGATGTPTPAKADGKTGTAKAEGATTTKDGAKADAAKSDSADGGKEADAQKGTDDQEATSGKTNRRRKPKLPSTRPPGAPPDPWTAFAETSERGPGRIRRAGRVVGRALLHEYALVTYGSLLLAVLLTWPTLRYPMHTLPQDIWDPARQAWQVSWAGHILITEPARLWHSNAFFPESHSFAFGSSLLGYAPAGLLGSGPLAAVLRYNILFVLAHALLAVGGYALVRQLGAGRTGALVGAVAFAYAPWRLAQEGHLDIISAGGIPLALAMLARGHGWSMRYGFRPGRRHAGWATAGWLVATWQISLGFPLGLPFAYVLAVLIVVVGLAVLVRRLRRRSPKPVLGWRLLVTDLLGALIFAGVGLLIALPYLRVPDTGPAGTEIKFFSPPLHGLLIGPAESRIWGAPHAVPRQSLGWPAEMALLPGFVLYALALVGLVFSVWRMWQRLLLLAAVVVSVILTLGTTFFDGRWTYLPLFGHLPASFGVRIPGRMMLWVTLLLAVLAAGAVAEFVRRAEHLAAHRVPPWPGPWLRLATLVPLLLVLVETWNATAHPVVPAQPAAMRTLTGPMLVLPTTALTDQTVMLWSTSRFQEVANGSGGFAPQRQSELRRSVATFPDVASIEYLRQRRIGTVLLLRSQTVGTPWERSGDVPVETLGIRREDLDDNAVVFYLD
ncbi:hypothetical protein [Actinoplanes auranticolor]|uniref:Uncharacterized protein n=1 Tax=Actinoplanes auranticolor TaxID=47988 RepID=A0A919SP12_9ACTN|nr:hypothetical protein [Actinoplanes auranticolor]GIM75269.1 hypothetical protein Aau02nite_65060 [Actinoplanes auranticolor]